MNPGEHHAADRERPWIGLASFSEGDSEFFAGRGEESEDLLRLVRRDTLTLLYGVSGLGKTSLLQAGLFPPLRADDFLPVPIRLDFADGTAPISAQVHLALAGAAAAARVECPQPRAEESLWEYFHRVGNDLWSARNDPVTPVLVFDQFEEIFTLGRESPERARRAEAFIAELAELVENRAPAALRADPQRAVGFDFKPARLKVLLAMREDYLADLDRLRTLFRDLGQNRLRLLPMGERQARSVIALGAPLLAPGVEDRILAFVGGSPSGDDLTVAPALLSLVLRELNERRLARGAETKITADLIDLEQSKILEGFYLRCLDGFPEGVRTFIEDELLTASGYRNSCALDDALAHGGVTQPVLDGLVTRRLLAYENRQRIRRVELTHDVLVPVIKARRDTRRIREEKARAAAAEIQILEKLRRSRRIAIGFGALGVCALLAAGIAVYAMLEAGSATLVATMAKQKAFEAQRETVRAMIDASWKAGLYLPADDPNILNSAKEEQLNAAYAATGSWIPGTRWLYGHLKALMDLEKLQSLAPMPIFVSGPHGRDFNIRSFDFGHYNPEFVRWGNENLIPGAANPEFRKATLPVYQKHLKEVARVYYLAYQHVEKNAAEAAVVREQYLESIRSFRRKQYDPKNSFLVGPAGIIQRFSDPFANEIAKGDMSFGGVQIPASARRSFGWASEMTGYFASTAPGFWIRRQIDGTAPDFFAGLTKLLETYDPAFLKDPAAP